MFQQELLATTVHYLPTIFLCIDFVRSRSNPSPKHVVLHVGLGHQDLKNGWCAQRVGCSLAGLLREILQHNDDIKISVIAIPQTSNIAWNKSVKMANEIFANIYSVFGVTYVARSAVFRHDTINGFSLFSQNHPFSTPVALRYAKPVLRWLPTNSTCG